jgi:hypothetical protein
MPGVRVRKFIEILFKLGQDAFFKWCQLSDFCVIQGDLYTLKYEHYCTHLLYNNTELYTELYFWSLLQEKNFLSAYYIPLELKLQCIIFLNRHAHKMFNWQLTLFWQQILFLQALKTVDKKILWKQFLSIYLWWLQKEPLTKKTRVLTYGWKSWDYLRSRSWILFDARRKNLSRYFSTVIGMK